LRNIAVARTARLGNCSAVRTLLVVLAASSNAFASPMYDGTEPSGWDRASFNALGGIVLGKSFNEQADDGFVLGGELSFVVTHVKDNKSLVPEMIWYGAYADVIHDYGSDQTRASIGPEVGFMMVGVDGGLLAQLSDESRVGFTIRPVVTFGVLALYVRHNRFADSLPDNKTWEAGVLIKYVKGFKR
jgi:hypothetical protein